MKILLAIDSDSSLASVIGAVRTQFLPAQTEIRVLHVIRPMTAETPPQMSPRWAPELDAEKHEAVQFVQRVTDELRNAGFHAQSSVEVGDIRECILASAEAWPADMIVVGSHGHGNVQRFFLGSVAESIARRARCSVEIVRQ